MNNGLYIHIPYCHAKCAYCDFYSTPTVSSLPRLLDSLVREGALRRHELNGRPISTVYIGGGTPSSLGGGQLAGLIGRLDSFLGFDNVLEMTVEVNPEDVDIELVETLASVGVNRVSMGVQSFVDSELIEVGRRHSAEDAVRASRLIASRFDNFTLDLIFGLPGQSLKSLNYSLDRLLELHPPHLSVYLLSYEPGTRLYARLVAGRVDEADDEMVQKMYRLITERLAGEGYEHYEISNYARPGYISRHNSSYWDSSPYLGLGPSAHSFDGVTRRFNPPNLKKYVESLEKGDLACEVEEETVENRFNDYIITRLRTARGLDLDDLHRQPFGHLIHVVESTVSRLIHAGDLIADGAFVRIDQERWMTADAVMRELIIC